MRALVPLSVEAGSSRACTLFCSNSKSLSLRRRARGIHAQQHDPAPVQQSRRALNVQLLVALTAGPLLQAGPVHAGPATLPSSQLGRGGLFLPPLASIPLEPDTSATSRARAAAQLGARYAAPGAAAGRPAAGAAPSTSERIQQALALLQQAREESEQGEYSQALASYNQLLGQYGDFAFTEYARVERALVMYQLGRVSDCLLQLEDEEVALRGYADVHAALAAVLYAERPAKLLLAEQQWEIAMEFDRRYSDVQWVQQQKHWPPRALEALQRFLRLT